MNNSVIIWIEENRQHLISLSDNVWSTPELGLLEEVSSKTLADALEKAGFTVERGVAKMPTAFIATYGSEKPVIGILGEYDALPGLSQDKVPYRKPLEKGAPGHGCGHNLLGVGALGACLAVKQEIESGNIKGTIRFYGSPAEEMFNAKGYMITNGLFDDVDIALTWHPASLNMVSYLTANAVNSVIFKFHGRTAHAAGDPHNGRSALDAVELMNVGCNYLREHMLPDCKLHYCILKGGVAPNIVPDEAEVWYFVRGINRKQAEDLYERVEKVAKGAALMTETEMEIDFLSSMYNTRYTKKIQEVLESKFKEVGVPLFDEEDKKFAEEIRKTFPEGSTEGLLRLVPQEFLPTAEKLIEQPLCDIILPPMGQGKSHGGSTDVGDVCYKVPTGEIITACSAIGNPGHSWQYVASSGMSIGHKGMLTAAKVLALTAIEFMQDSTAVEQAKKEFKEWTKGEQYKSPFPDDLIPPFRQYEK